MKNAVPEKRSEYWFENAPLTRTLAYWARQTSTLFASERLSFSRNATRGLFQQHRLQVSVPSQAESASHKAKAAIRETMSAIGERSGVRREDRLVRIWPDRVSKEAHSQSALSQPPSETVFRRGTVGPVRFFGQSCFNHWYRRNRELSTASTYFCISKRPNCDSLKA